MPRLPQSELLEDFIKLSQSVGILKEGYPNLQAYEDDAEARAGSDDISTIEALYGVKQPDPIEGMDYEHNIMESAHRDPVIIAPSYDKINGLVENHNERANIMHNIVMKPTDGLLTNRKYARKELVLELVRIANEMDNKNHEQLFKLADQCLSGLQSEAGLWDDTTNWFSSIFHDAPSVGKGALSGAGIGALIGALVTSWSGPGMLVGVTAGAAVGGLISAFLATGPHVENVQVNAQKVIDEIADLDKKVPESSEFLQSISAALASLVKSSTNYREALNKLHALSAGAVPDQKSIEDASKKFLSDVATVAKAHREFTRRASSGEFAAAGHGKATSPIYWFISDDIQDVEEAFNSLDEAVSKLKDSTRENVSQAVEESKDAPIEHPAAQTVAKKPEEKSEGLDMLKSVQDMKIPS